MAKNSKFKALAGVGVLLLAVAIGGIYMLTRDASDKAPNVPSDIKLTPATDDEKKAADQNKDRLVEQGEKTDQSQASNTKKQVNIIITNANHDNINAYVTGVFEEGGVCTATFSQGDSNITRTSVGFGNVSYTQCAPISPDLPNTGTWSVIVSYSSNNAEGKSQAQVF